MMELFQLVVCILVLVISIICIYYMYYVKKEANVAAIIKKSVSQSEFTPTKFLIYDKSSQKLCNRLVVVEPFHWYIWAIRGELYILNPESGVQCGVDSTPAIRVYATQFVETCLKISMNAIIETYTRDLTPTVVSYDINDTTFTILSAINILAKSYITFDKELLTNNNSKQVTAKHVLASSGYSHQKLQRQFAKHTKLARGKAKNMKSPKLLR